MSSALLLLLVALAALVLGVALGRFAPAGWGARTAHPAWPARAATPPPVPDLITAQQRAEQDRLEAHQAQNEFLANISHEIRTPMTAILGYVDVLLDELETAGHLAEKWRMPLNTIRSNGQHLLQLINDILDISKIDAGRLNVEKIPCSIGQLVNDVVNLLEHRAAEKGLLLQVRYRTEIPQVVYSDPTRLRQILLNLVGNAIKFTNQGKVTVDLELRPTDHEPILRIQVSDTGIGISGEQLTRLFEPFVQADASTTRNFGGTGLGLTITRRLCGLLGGTITANSKLGRGSTFWVDLPCRQAENSPLVDRPLQNVAAAPRRPVETRVKGHILLAEDGPDNQRLLRTILEKAGAQVTVADNGRAAVDLALPAPGEPAPFDLLLLDMQMPLLDGWEVARRLRAAGFTQPIVALTANAMPEDREKCLAAGCDDFVSKPIDRPILLTTVSRWLENRGPRLPALDIARLLADACD